MADCRPPTCPPKEVDENLRPYATELQWAYLLAWVKHRGYRQAATALGRSRSVVRDAIALLYGRAAQQGYAPDYDLTHQVPDGMTSRGTSILYDEEGNVKEYWNKSRAQGRAPEEVVKLADPKIVSKVSTLFDHQGRVTQQWVSEHPEAAAQASLWEEAAKAFAEKLPRGKPIKAPKKTDEDMMAVYPIGDHHLGMLSWEPETGANWDVKIGEDALTQAMDYLTQATPQCAKAAVLFLGDFMHYDSFATVTPTAKNPLDVDGRFPKLVRAAIRSMRRTIEQAAKRHAFVHVIVEIGNHDLASSIFLMECLRSLYENDPRVKVDTSPRHFHYLEFGTTLIGTHHGHGAKPGQLPGIMAADEPEAWGRTQHRYWYTGHIHHETRRDYTGVSVESFRILAPDDSWAYQKGYRAERGMKAILIHKEFGEVARQTVTPQMFLR